MQKVTQKQHQRLLLLLPRTTRNLLKLRSNLDYDDFEHGPDTISPSDLDIGRNFRKLEIVILNTFIDDEHELSDNIQARLLLARTLAIMKYNNKKQPWEG